MIGGEHFVCRWNLMKTLGVIPSAIYGKKFFEVEAGTGVNSTYVSKLSPEVYDICEGNQASIKELQKKISLVLLSEKSTKLICGDFLDIDFPEKYDFVFAENCVALQNSNFIEKLMSLVNFGGSLILTSVLLTCWLADSMCRYFYPLIYSQTHDNEKTRELILKIVEPHVARTKTNKFLIDWAEDNIFLRHSSGKNTYYLSSLPGILILLVKISLFL